MKLKIRLFAFLFAIMQLTNAQEYNQLTDYSYHGKEKIEESSIIPLPSAKQLAFQELELGLFIHFGLDTYTGQSAGDGKQPGSMFNPTNLDCEQWMKVAKDMGAKYVMLTVRHEGGFCIWPSETTEYSVRNSPWKNGKGDVVKEYVDAARKFGLKVGLYHASWHDANQFDWRDLNYFADKPGELERFTRLQLAQLTELLTNYGEIDMMWFDHHDCPHAGANQFWRRVDKLVGALQPNCMIFGNDYWLNGGHSGEAYYPLWYGSNKGDGTIHSRPVDNDSRHGNPFGKFFVAWEANTIFSGNWFYNGPVVKPLPEMIDAYYKSIGHGTNFLPNFAPDKSGIMPPEVVKSAKEFGDELRKRFGNKIAGTSGKKEIKLSLAKKTNVNNIVVMEDISQGQKVAAFEIDAKKNGKWKIIYSGQTIGHKHIVPVELETDELRFRSMKSLDDAVIIREFAVY
jgi:alpha-L-fucosidase